MKRTVRLGARHGLLTAPPLLPLLIWACNSHPLQAPDPHPDIQTNDGVVIQPFVKLDLVFMVDNSLSMVQEQDSLAVNFPRFMEELQKVGDIDLRVGVVSSNVGAGGAGGPCMGLGDGGQFKVNPGCGLEPGAKFLSMDRDGNKNFTGPLTEAFGCLAKLGTQGCGYEHQLQSVRFALYSDQAKQFLREDAHLGIVIITDEDDCSGDPESTLYAETRPGENPNLRCATAGHLCGGQPITAATFTAPLASCTPFERTNDEQGKRQRLINVSEFVDHIKGIKAGSPFKVLVSGIIGWDESAGASYNIARNDGVLDLSPICASAAGAWAMPGVRLKAFIDAFGGQGSVHSICQGDLRQALTDIGKNFGGNISGFCFDEPLLDADSAQPGLQPDCAVSIRPTTGGPASVVPRCADATSVDCWELQSQAQCAGPYFNIRKQSLAGALSAGCATCAIPGDPRCATN
jgi:hypothetical protein